MRQVITNFFSGGSQARLGIDIGSGAIKIAEVTRRGSKMAVNSFGIAELPNQSLDAGEMLRNETVTASVRAVLRSMKTSCRFATVGVGGRSVYSREISLPAGMNEKEMKEAIKWDSDQYVPYAPGSYYYDFSVIGSATPENELKVLLVATPKELVEAILQLCQELELRLVAVDFEALALLHSMQGIENTLAIDIGSYACQVTVFQEGSPVVVRTIPIGGAQFTETISRVLQLEFNEAEQKKIKERNWLVKERLQETGVPLEAYLQLKLLIEELAREVQRTTEYYQMQNRELAIDRVVLTGGGANLPRLDTHLAELLGITVDVGKAEPLSLPPAYDQTYLEGIFPRLAVAIGLGMRGCSHD